MLCLYIINSLGGWRILGDYFLLRLLRVENTVIPTPHFIAGNIYISRGGIVF